MTSLGEAAEGERRGGPAGAQTFRRQPLGRFADTYNIVYMTFKAIHMLIAEVEQSSNGPPEYNRRRHDFTVAGRSRAASCRRVNSVITTLRQELTRIKSGDMGCQESVVVEKNYEDETLSVPMFRLQHCMPS